ncbi:MAG: DUF1289 domain-containing protein [Halioglobus sp.]|nr:DUF1289 domain-containing protein [Halioglobus sp.]
MSGNTPQSPCISVCVLDDDDICLGCYRSAAEITDWFMASDEEKREVLRRARERRDGSFPVQLQ